MNATDDVSTVCCTSRDLSNVTYRRLDVRFRRGYIYFLHLMRCVTGNCSRVGYGATYNRTPAMPVVQGAALVQAALAGVRNTITTHHLHTVVSYTRTGRDSGCSPAHVV